VLFGPQGCTDYNWITALCYHHSRPLHRSSITPVGWPLLRTPASRRRRPFVPLHRPYIAPAVPSALVHRAEGPSPPCLALPSCCLAPAAPFPAPAVGPAAVMAEQRCEPGRLTDAVVLNFFISSTLQFSPSSFFLLQNCPCRWWRLTGGITTCHVGKYGALRAPVTFDEP
jgi:hypothetical protein